MSEDAAAKRRARQTVTNLALALGASVAMVVALVMLVPRDDTSLIKKVDYVAIASDAAASTKLPVIVPTAKASWWCNSARWSAQPGDGTAASWYVGFVGPDDKYIGFTQTYSTNATWLAVKLGSLSQTGTLDAGGRSWQVWKSKEVHTPPKTRDYMLISGQKADTFMIYGTASESEMKSFATGVSQQISKVYP